MNEYEPRMVIDDIDYENRDQRGHFLWEKSGRTVGWLSVSAYLQVYNQYSRL